jgi:hypothetical protein
MSKYLSIKIYIDITYALDIKVPEGLYYLVELFIYPPPKVHDSLAGLIFRRVLYPELILTVKFSSYGIQITVMVQIIISPMRKVEV